MPAPSEQKKRPVLVACLAFFLWLFPWATLGLAEGITVGGHAWIAIPMISTFYGFVSAVVFTVLVVCRLRTAQLSPLRAAFYGSLAGLAGMPLVWSVVHIGAYWVVVIGSGAVLGALLSLLFPLIQRGKGS
jgi:hypothetical protein